MSKETGITKQDVTILKAYSSEFDKLPAKMTKFQKTMETTEKLLNEFAQADYTATIFLDDQVTPALDSVSGRLRSFSRNAYKVSVSVDMRKVYTDIYAAERRIRSMQLQPGYSSRYMMPYAGTSVSGAGAIPAQTTSSQNSFDSVMSIGSAIVTANNLNEMYKDYTKIKKNPTKYANFKAGLPKAAANAITAYGFLDGGADIAEGVFSSDNAYDRTYKVTEGATIMAGSFAGMKAGAAMLAPLGPWGALAGAAGGYLFGKLLSEPVADSFADGIAGAEEYADVSARAAEKVSELNAQQKALASTQLGKLFGNTALSAKEVSQVVGELFDTGQTMRINNAAAAIDDLQASFVNLQQADYGLQKTLWLSGTEAGAGNLAGLMGATSDFGESSRMHLLDNQYAERESVKVLLPESGSAEELLEGIDERYQKKLEELDTLTEKLDKTTIAASSDGVIDSSEQMKIDGIRQEILQLLYGESGSKTKQQQDTDFQAILEKMKLGLGKEYSKESFEAIIQDGTAAANERVAALENAYSYAAIGKTDKEKQTLLWGKDGTGQTDGLYKQELDTYGAIAGNAMNEFVNKMPDKLGFLDNLVEEKNSGEFSGDTLARVRALQGNEADRETIKGFLDIMEPIYSQMEQTAQLFEEMGMALPEESQNFMDKMEALFQISEAEWINKSVIGREGNTYGDEYLKTELRITGEKEIENQVEVTPEDFGIASVITKEIPILLTGIAYGALGKGKNSQPKGTYRGGIIAPAFADGGYVHGGAQLITVAEEGTPEAIIPLGRHRRKRALELFNQVGGYLQAPGFSPKGFAAGGIVGSIGSLSGGAGGSGAPVAIEVGGVEIKVEAKDGQSLVETIRENKEAISEEIAGVFNAAFKGQFANTPAAGGAGL